MRPEGVTEFFAVGRFALGMAYLKHFFHVFQADHALGHFAVGQFAVRTVRRRDPCMQITEETIAKYAVDANLFRL